MDVIRYFPNIDHEILMRAIEKRIKDKDILWLIGVILESGRETEDYGCLSYFRGDDLFTPVERRKGLPIGNLTSQLFANIYLDSFDHYVKEHLRCKCYIRYMDDMAVFDDSKERLRDMRPAMIQFLEELRLKIHAKRAQYWPVKKGTDWLGYRIYPTHRRLRKSNIRRFRLRLKSLADEYRQGTVDLQKIQSSVMSWIGHAKHADSYNLRKKIFGKVSFQRG